MPTIAYVILHYLDAELTKKCVDSILKTYSISERKIIIVDNGSNNGSGESLKETYFSQENIEVIIAKNNQGFARGNNIGYVIARAQGADFIIMCNNDLIFEQKDFEGRIMQHYSKSGGYIAAPDIKDVNGNHLSPIYCTPLTYWEVYRKIRFKEVSLTLLKLSQKVSAFSYITNYAEKYKNMDTSKWNRNFYKKKTNIVPCGACLIFFPRAINDRDYAFNPGTFMYCEEYILSFECNQENQQIDILDDIYVLHIGEGSTNKLLKDSFDKHLFKLSNSIVSLKLLLNMMRHCKVK